MSEADAQRGLDVALDSMSDAFALFDAEDRLILHNSRYLDFFPFLRGLGDLQGVPFCEMVTAPNAEWNRTGNPDGYIEERMRRHFAADGEPFDIPLLGGGWARVRERRTPDGGIVSTWTDISQLKAAEQHLLGAIAGIGEGFVLLDDDLHIRLVNDAFREMHAGAGLDRLEGAELGELIHRGTEAGLYDLAGDGHDQIVDRILAAVDQEGGRLEIGLRGGGCVLVNHQRMPEGGVVGIWTDVSSQKQRERELLAARQQLQKQSDALSEFARLLARQARSDSLTGLPNRLALEAKLAAALQEQLSGVWVMFVDIDRFKTINDAAGHGTGDEVLCAVGRFLRSRLHPEDMVARLGGDEFAILITEMDEADVMEIATGLIESTRAAPFAVAGRRFALGLSIGIATPSAELASASSLLAAADTACYLAKEAGRGRVHLYRSDPSGSSHEALGWGERIAAALREDRFALRLQAIVDNVGTVVGYEALIRLVDEHGQVRSPANFLPAARRVGLMDRIDEWVCRRTVDYARQLLRQGGHHYVSMNFGAGALSDPLFQKRLISLLDANPGVERTLRVEITETDQIADPRVLASFLAHLRRRGIRLYLDDFGSGYNSFDLLKHLRVDGIKIDWTVTHDLLSDPIDEALIRAAVSIAGSLGLELVAEGVEGEPELNRLRALGVRLFQGHYFHQPEDAASTLPRATAALPPA
nr:EAL domain-containing protein [Ancylobacter lacus]